MSTVEMKAEIPLLLERVEDNFVEAVHALLNAHITKQEEDVPMIPYDAKAKPEFDSVEELVEELDRRIDAIRVGEFVTLEELKKESLTWREKHTA